MNATGRLGLLAAVLLPVKGSAHLPTPSFVASLAQDIPFAAAFDPTAATVPGVTQSALGDLNRDGLPDIGVLEGGKHAERRRTFAWFETPAWKRHEFDLSLQPGPFTGAAVFADIDRDGRLGVVVSSDLHSGGIPLGSMFWFRNPGGAATGNWARHTIVQDLSDTEHIFARQGPGARRWSNRIVLDSRSPDSDDVPARASC